MRKVCSRLGMSCEGVPKGEDWRLRCRDRSSKFGAYEVLGLERGDDECERFAQDEECVVKEYLRGRIGGWGARIKV